MAKAYGVIYKAANKINGKVYIGQTTQSLNVRIGNHIIDAVFNRDNMYFHKAIRKHGKENFDWEIIAKCNSLEELNKTEIEMIKRYNTFNIGYNLTKGGEGTFGRVGKKAPMYGKRHTEESKRKIGNSHKGSIHSLETRQKMSRAKKGRKLSEEHKKALKGLQKGSNNVHSKKYIITTPEGKDIFVHGLREFCVNYKEEKLNFKSLSCCAVGKCKQHKGYKCRYYKNL